MLLDQAAESFEKFAYRDVIPRVGSFQYRIISGAHQSSANINPKDNLLIVSKDSIRSHLERLDGWLKGSDEIYLVVDEAHHSTAKTYKKVIDHLRSKVPHLKIIGLTATPTRTFVSEQGLLAKIYTHGVKGGQPFNNRNTPDRLGMVYKIGLKELIKRGILSNPEFRSYETGMHYGEGLARKALERIQTLDRLPEELEREIARSEARNKIIVEKYKENAAIYGKTLVFAVNIEHARILTERFNAAGIKAAYVVSGTDHLVREKIYDDYRKGNLQVLVNVNILTEGTDLPMTQTVFLTRQTTSTILMTQMIGRGLRGLEAGGTKEAPETIFLDEINLPDEVEILPPIKQQTEEEEEIIYISQEKILEFARILNEAIDTTEIEAIPFIERIPLGMYAFQYESKEEGTEDGGDVSYQVMVYSSTKDAYEKFMAALPGLFKGFNRFNYADDSEEYLSPDTLRQLLDYCKENFFSGEMILPYDENDIKHVLEYFAQKGVSPKFYTFAQIEREKLDVSTVAQEIWEKDMGERTKATYLNLLWNGGNKNIWRIFFVDKRYFLKMVEIELTKLAHPEIYAAYQKKLTTFETTTIILPNPAKPPATTTKEINLATVDEMIHELEEELGYNKLAVKKKILAALSEIEETAQKNRDADKMNKIAVRYRKIHEHANSARCDSIATLYRLSS